MTLPAPSLLLGISGQFPSWYPGQEYAISRVLDWLPRESDQFMCLSIPTGSGKSLIALLAAVLSGKRTVILTATKGLQAQIGRDFSSLVVDIRGQNSYQCKLEGNITCDEGPCHAGFGCQFRDNGCLYYDRVREAVAAPVVVTNYAYWLSQNEYADGLGNRSLLIMDEAHLAFSAIESHLATHVELMDVESIGTPFPDNPAEWPDWRRWATVAERRAAQQAETLKEAIRELREHNETVPRAESQAFRRATVLVRKLNRIANSVGRWVSERDGNGWTFTPIWLDEYSGLLYVDVPKVIAMSAILTPESASHLSMPEGREFLSMPSLFPIANTPVSHIGTVRMNHRVTPTELKMWVGRIDQIIDRRMDRKGIIFTVSYQRRNLLMNNSRYRHLMISHGQRDVVEMVNRFRRSEAPAILVSPTVTSGWDFPGDQCEYIVIGKLPYPDTRSELVKARLADDPDWTSFLAMQTLIQSAGRGSRSASDVCEVLVIDDSWRWFWPRYRKYAPIWFHQRVRGSTDLIPQPPGRDDVNVRPPLGPLSFSPS